MKKTVKILIAFSAAVGLFLLGWFCGQRSTANLAGKVTKSLMYGHAQNNTIEQQMLLEQIDSQRIEDAKQSIYLHMDGNILMLNSLLEETNPDMTVSAMKILMQMDEGTDAQYGPKQATANKILARVANYRAKHPWTYSGQSPQPNNADVEAKLAEILKNAAASQK